MKRPKIPLPPPGMRLCGPEYKDDNHFVGSALAEVDRLAGRSMLGAHSRVLEIGCGPGRFAIGILHRLGLVASYTGVDVKPGVIRWCQENLDHPGFRFVHLDIQHPRYNAGGRLAQETVRLPAQNWSADLIYLYSVFSHMPEAQVDAHLQEFARVLAPNGRVDLTGFFESGVEPMAENPPGYLRERWNGALHCVRYDREFFEAKVRAAGLEVVGFEHQVTPSGQSRYTLARREDA